MANMAYTFHIYASRYFFSNHQDALEALYAKTPAHVHSYIGKIIDVYDMDVHELGHDGELVYIQRKANNPAKSPDGTGFVLNYGGVQLSFPDVHYYKLGGEKVQMPEPSRAQDTTHDDAIEMLKQTAADQCDAYVGHVWNEQTARLLASDINEAVNEFVNNARYYELEVVHDELAEIKAMIATMMEK